MTGPIGLSMATRSGLAPDVFGQLAGEAERAGFSAVFLAEGGSDVLAICPSVIAATETVTVGTAIANAYLHPPVLTALTCAALDDLSGGRFVLGLGTANPRLNHDVLGLPRTSPLALIEEYVEAFRAVQTGQSYAGEVFQFAGPIAWDRPLGRPVPLHLAALQPRMLALAGKVADGVVLNLMSPEQCAEAVSLIRAAASSAGRDPGGVSITAVLQSCLSDDAAAARVAANGVVLNYAAHPATAAMFAAADPDGAMDGVRALLGVGDRAGARDAVPASVADAFVLHGDAAGCRDRLAEFRSAGIDLPVVFPTPVDGDWVAQYRQVIAAVGG